MFFVSKYKIFLFLFFILLNNSSFSSIKGDIDSVKIIKVNSLEQKIEDLNKIILRGNVEVLIDKKMHLWADEVFIDRKKQVLIAKKINTANIVIESKDLLILGDELFLDLGKKVYYAKNLRVHVPEGYILAKFAEKKDEYNWIMRDILFTPCDAVVPHWSIVGRKAILYKNCLVKLSGLLFKVGQIPFFSLPYLILPLQKQSKSGFLLPRFAYDNDLGLGLRQEFYWSIAEKCDNTIGIDWRKKRGLALINEFRLARSKESFSLFNLRYALERNAFVKKSDYIKKDTDRRYWVDGKDFRILKGLLSNKKVNSLMRVDFGTDKKIGYHFFDNFLRLDDTFYNSEVLRYINNFNVINFYFDSIQTKKSKFIVLNNLERSNLLDLLIEEDKKYINTSKKEIDDRVFVCVFPHFEWNNIFSKIGKEFFFRQDFFIDHVLSREKKKDKFYVNSKVVKEGDLSYLAKADSFRLFYNLDFQTGIKVKNHNFLFGFTPNCQLRTNIRDYNVKEKKKIEGSFLGWGKYSFFIKWGAEWIMPELLFEDNYNNTTYYIQPSFKWDFLPKFEQDHWFYSDKWDRFYPTNKLEFNLKNNWNISNLFIDLSISQGVDFYNKSDRFLLERCPDQNNLLPLDVEVRIDSDVLDFTIKQEYAWKNLQLLSTQINLSFFLKNFNFYLSSIYQSKKLQYERALFSDIPNFLILSFSVPLVKNAKLTYDGQFYSEKGTNFLPFESLKSLRNFIKFDYEGHCWGISLGYEEKKYKECGNWKSDKAYTLFVKLKSIGSFTRKFKKPFILTKNKESL